MQKTFEQPLFPLSKDYYKRLSDRLSDFKESTELLYLEDFSLILQVLQHLNISEDSRGIFLENIAIFELLISEIFMAVAKTLIFRRTFRNKELLELSNKILENMVNFSLKTIEEDNIKLLELMRFILDPSRAYYKLNDQEENSLFSVNLSLFFL